MTDDELNKQMDEILSRLPPHRRQVVLDAAYSMFARELAASPRAQAIRARVAGAAAEVATAVGKAQHTAREQIREAEADLEDALRDLKEFFDHLDDMTRDVIARAARRSRPPDTR